MRIWSGAALCSCISNSSTPQYLTLTTHLLSCVCRKKMQLSRKVALLEILACYCCTVACHLLWQAAMHAVAVAASNSSFVSNTHSAEPSAYLLTPYVCRKKMLLSGKLKLHWLRLWVLIDVVVTGAGFLLLLLLSVWYLMQLCFSKGSSLRNWNCQNMHMVTRINICVKQSVE